MSQPQSQPPSHPPSAQTSGPSSNPATPVTGTPGSGTPGAATPVSRSGPGTPTGVPHPNLAVPQQMLSTLATFHAHMMAHQAHAANPAAGRPPIPPLPVTTANFLALPAERQRQIHTTFLARQRTLQQQQAAARAGQTNQALHPSLGTTNAAASSPYRGGPNAPRSATGPRPKDNLKRLRIDVPERKPSPTPPPRPVKPMAALIHAASARPFPSPGPRPREDGFRGSIRNEVARLMYACGDVKEPLPDSVDYVEDLALEFLADFIRPTPPIRGRAQAPRQPVALNVDTLRHRLASQPQLKKYLERWDDMTYMQQEINEAQRNYNPKTDADVIQSVGHDFLGVGDEEASGAGTKRRTAADGEDGSKKRGRPAKAPEERKKPGPKKGWKKNLDPNAPKKKAATFKKKGTGTPSSALGSPSKAA